MKKIYFISDVHLGYPVKNGQEQEKIKKLLAFLAAISGEADELFIVGDLFDFWFEWYHVIPKYWFPLLAQFKIMTRSGIKINFITGNHDFYHGSFLNTQLGLNCFNAPVERELAGKKFFIAHGDGFARKDRGYRLLKKIIRHRLAIFLFKTVISPDLGMQIAIWTSRTSRKLDSNRKSLWADEYFEYARQKFNQGFDYVVLGHLHTPELRKEGSGTYLNCGDWITEFSYGVFDGKQLQLKKWQE